jgi:hypothetical protein
VQEFKLIVAGSRGFNNYFQLSTVVESLATHDLAEYSVSLVSGMARGADKLAWEYAKKNNIQCYEFPADWNTNGRSAGYIRNTAMAEFADGLLAFHDGVSKGTAHMIQIMRLHNKPVQVHQF